MGKAKNFLCGFSLKAQNFEIINSQLGRVCGQNQVQYVLLSGFKIVPN